MGETLVVSFIICAVSVILWAMKALYTIWWTPKKLERALRKQGIEGPLYKLFFGNIKENFGRARHTSYSVRIYVMYELESWSRKFVGARGTSMLRMNLLKVNSNYVGRSSVELKERARNSLRLSKLIGARRTSNDRSRSETD
ncbi:hypothetical protein GIB67_001133 [Kingdonia uniflora]|uniref:Uncharacterized protein n=1 Tax=Kingdonia uniflora TaxID=39325 RepID=A0A7J7MH88_9MAGN|nr:hypothetical protein GIB67_001133 [Kingdonia uniflora]